MKRIIDGKLFDTDKCERLLHSEWSNPHPNVSGDYSGMHDLNHERALYRTKSGRLYVYEYDEEGYGRDRNGVSGTFVRKRTRCDQLFGGAREAVQWAEDNSFDAEDITEHFANEVGEA
jgi:hypothetical protein